MPGPAAGNTAGWLTATALIHGRSARAEVRLAEDLTDRYRATADALLAGALDLAQARAVAQALNRLPDWVSLEDRARAEAHLLDEARRLDAVQLRSVGKRLLEVIDPEGAEAEEARRLQAEADDAAARTSLSMWDDGEGTTNIWAKVPTSHGVMLRKALHAIANPQLADAIPRTNRTQPQVMGEAFCRLLETFDPESLPSSGGLNAAVVVTMSLETLLGGLGAATLDSGDRIAPGEARRMACAAGVIPAVLGSRSQLLDLGRRVRLYTKPQRVAMAVQQGFTCAVERCDAPDGVGGRPPPRRVGLRRPDRRRRRCPDLRTTSHPGAPSRLPDPTPRAGPDLPHPRTSSRTPTPIAASGPPRGHGVTRRQSMECSVGGAGNGRSNVSGSAPTAEAIPSSSATATMPAVLASLMRTMRVSPSASLRW